jgi:hypothetical protein
MRLSDAAATAKASVSGLPASDHVCGTTNPSGLAALDGAVDRKPRLSNDASEEEVMEVPTRGGDGFLEQIRRGGS